ncbi:MAG TPA: nitroreductase family protein [Candidatus Competibacter sp.]|nr:nitroreductase [Candidatus Competibacteraceae bacterium]HRE55375.1 nitroreductase family protein [Candidatus Competibacter sp.]
MLVKPATTQVPIADLIARRWSSRAIDPNRPVNRDHLLALLEAARWAPSCFGDEPWRYLVWNRFHDAAAWQQAFECLAEGNQLWVRHAPVLLLSVAAPAFGHNNQPNRWAQHDTGAASENLCLQAAALGLVAHQMGGFDSEQAKTRFNIPADHTCMAMIAVGHPAPAESLPDETRKKELETRKRKPLNKFVFEGNWANAFEP